MIPVLIVASGVAKDVLALIPVMKALVPLMVVIVHAVPTSDVTTPTLKQARTLG